MLATQTLVSPCVQQFVTGPVFVVTEMALNLQMEQLRLLLCLLESQRGKSEGKNGPERDGSAKGLWGKKR